MSMKPSVKDAYEFLEIMNDFTDPREVIREAISNSYDAEAKKLEIEIIRFQESGNPELKIIIKDDGEGMIGEPQNSDEKKIPTVSSLFRKFFQRLYSQWFSWFLIKLPSYQVSIP
jgi:hypothetical protein